MGDRLNFQIAWPGVIAPQSVEYVNSHGISPGRAELRCNPQPGITIGENGDLVFQDSDDHRIIIPDCRLRDIEEVPHGKDGFEWVLHIEDRRWRWAETGRISGEFNLRDAHDKLIGWSIRSPTELAALCLAEMGESNFQIELPFGLDSIIGGLAWATQPPWLGAHDVTGMNPSIHWDCEVPAHALNAIVEQMGRRVIYRVLSNSILIAVPGQGDDLPLGGRSVAQASPTVNNPMIPSGITAESAPTKFQMRLRLIPVGEDWDGGYRPINNLTYAPSVGGQIQIVKARISNYPATTVGSTWRVILNSAVANDPTAGVAFSYVDQAGDGAVDVLDALAALINASNDPRVQGIIAAAVNPVEIPEPGIGVAAEAGTPELVLEGRNQGQSWSCLTEVDGVVFGTQQTEKAFAHCLSAATAAVPYNHITNNAARPNNPNVSCQVTVTAAAMPGSPRSMFVLLHGESFAGGAALREPCPDNDVMVANQIRLALRADRFVNSFFLVGGSLNIVTIKTRQALVNDATMNLSIVKGAAVDSCTGLVDEPTSTHLVAGIAGVVRGAGPSFDSRQTQAARSPTRCWEHLSPPQNGEAGWGWADGRAGNVQATDRLTAQEAWELANRTVYKCFQLADTDVSFDPGDTRPLQLQGAGANRTTPTWIKVPGFGALLRRQQIVLTDTQVEQVVPEPEDEQLQVAGQLVPQSVNLYRGFSRDKPAKLFGSVARHLLTRWLVADNPFGAAPPLAGLVAIVAIGQTNTPADAELFFPFSIDQEQQVIRFEDALYTLDNGKHVAADLILETGVYIRHPTTNQLVCLSASRALRDDPPATLYHAKKFPDVQPGIIGLYDSKERLVAAKLLEQDPLRRLGYYLDGMQAQYFLNGALTVEYNGLELIELDGAIRQVTWQMDETGSKTIASRNTEHSVYVPPFGTRLRAEFLSSFQASAHNVYAPRGPAPEGDGNVNRWRPGLGPDRLF